jgi:hypothetical protein
MTKAGNSHFKQLLRAANEGNTSGFIHKQIQYTAESRASARIGYIAEMYCNISRENPIRCNSLSKF